MSLKTQVNIHTGFWIAWLLLFAIVTFMEPQGRWYDRKYLYAVASSAPYISDFSPDKATFQQEIEKVKDNVYGEGDLSRWPSGLKMNIFKNELGCFGESGEEFQTYLKAEPFVYTEGKTFEMLIAQHTYNNAPHSVCTCIDKLYYASFKNTPTEGDLSPILLASTVTNKVKAVLNSLRTTFTADVKKWMLETTYTDSSRYDGTGFATIMIRSKSDDADMHCKYYDDKSNSWWTDKTKCIQRRDLEIISVCSRSAQSILQIDYKGIVNAAWVRTFGILSIFWYVFLVLHKHHTAPDSKPNYIFKSLTYVAMFGLAVALFFVWIGINWGFDMNWVWWTAPFQWTLHSFVILAVSTLVILDVIIALAVMYSKQYDNTDDARGLRLKHILTEHIHLKYIVTTQILLDIPLIVGFSILFNALLLDAGVTESGSLSIVVVMGTVAGFVQHVSNILHQLEIRTRNIGGVHDGIKSHEEVSSMHVDTNTFRFMKECAAHRVYIALVTVIISVYLLVYPRESYAHPAGVLYTASVVFFFLVFTAFDMIREVDHQLKGHESMWISMSDKDSIKSIVLLFFVFLLISTVGARSHEYFSVEPTSSTNHGKIFY